MPNTGLQITQFEYLPKFRRHLRRLPVNIQDLAKETLKTFLEDPASPGLNLEKLPNLPKKSKGTFSIRVNLYYRISLKINGSTAILRNIGSHDEVYSNP